MDGTAAALYLCRFLLAGTFLLSVVPKLRDQAPFRDAVRAFRVVPAWVRPVAWAVTAAEAAVVLLLVIAPSQAAGFALAALLLAAFSVGMWRVLRAGSRTTCNCFGRSAAVISGAHLLRNGVLTLCAITGGALAGMGLPALGAGGLGLLSLFGLALLTVVYFFDDLVLVLAPHLAPGPGQDGRNRLTGIGWPRSYCPRRRRTDLAVRTSTSRAAVRTAVPIASGAVTARARAAAAARGSTTLGAADTAAVGRSALRGPPAAAD